MRVMSVARHLLPLCSILSTVHPEQQHAIKTLSSPPQKAPVGSLQLGGPGQHPPSVPYKPNSVLSRKLSQTCVQQVLGHVPLAQDQLQDRHCRVRAQVRPAGDLRTLVWPLEDIPSLPLTCLGSAGGRASARRHRPAQAAMDGGLEVLATRPGTEDLL